MRPLLIATFAFLTSPLTAQVARPLVGTVEQAGSCRTCNLTASRVMVYGSADDKELIPDAPAYLMLRNGGLLVGNQRGGLILRYGADGRYANTFGRVGDGPGEYRRTKVLLEGPGDSVTVLSANSIAVISLLSGRGRSKSLGATFMPTDMVRLKEGQLVINTHYPNQKAFILLSPTLDRISALGPLMERSASGQYEETIFPLAASALGGFWAAKREYVHRIERWSGDGRVLQRLDSLVSWFPRYPPPVPSTEGQGFGASYTERPKPFIPAIHEDPEGRLWVLTMVADAKWAPVQSLPQFETYEEYRAYVPPQDPNRHLDAIIEVYNVRTGQLEGAWRFHEGFHGILRDGTLWRMQQGDEGTWSLEVWRLDLQ